MSPLRFGSPKQKLPASLQIAVGRFQRELHPLRGNQNEIGKSIKKEKNGMTSAIAPPSTQLVVYQLDYRIHT